MRGSQNSRAGDQKAGRRHGLAQGRNVEPGFDKGGAQRREREGDGEHAPVERESQAERQRGQGG